MTSCTASSLFPASYTWKSGRETLSLISHTFTLRSGDLLATGTPSGVGYGRTPPCLLQPGDVVEVEVERLGVLTNRVVGNDARRKPA